MLLLISTLTVVLTFELDHTKGETDVPDLCLDLLQLVIYLHPNKRACLYYDLRILHLRS
jgi:hypothetical protein